jgi:hypothetical protein
MGLEAPFRLHDSQSFRPRLFDHLQLVAQDQRLKVKGSA